MVEILFGENGATSMKMAIEKGVISGTLENVICLDLILDIGNIREKVDSTYRQNLIFDMYTQNGYDNSEDTLKELQEVKNQYIDEHNRLMDYVLKGEPIRIWYSNTPYDMCGFYYICDLLKDVSNEISAVKLPGYIQIHDVIVLYQSWGEIIPEKFSAFIKYGKRISQMERKLFGDDWLKLIEDNSPLRATINGQLIGVPVDFYDHLIYKYLKVKPMKEIQLIGSILENYPIGVGEWWYASRIEHMIENNKIKILEDSDMKYLRILSNI